MADPQPRQGCVELLEYLRARQTFIGAAHWKVELGRQNITVAADSHQRFAEDLLRGAASIDIGGIEQRDAAIQRAMHAGNGIAPPGAVRKSEPGAEGDF